MQRHTARAIGALLLSTAAAAASAATTYKAEWIRPDLVNKRILFDGGRINNHGVIVGGRGIQGNAYARPFRWSAADGYREGHDLPGGEPWAELADVNEHGIAVGFASAETRQHAAIFTESGRIRDLAPLLPDGMRSNATGINESGEVVGFYSARDYPRVEDARVFAWSPDAGMSLIALPEGYDYAVPVGINDAGLIAGWGCGPHDCGGFQGTAAGGLHGFIVDGLPTAVNARGEIVGRPFGDGPAFIWDAILGARSLPMPAGSTQCWASDINAKGVVVGQCNGAHGGPIAWHPADGTGYGLSRLALHIGGQPDPWPYCNGELCYYVESALSINDLGQIVVQVATYPYAYIDEGDLLLLTPVDD